VLFHTWTFLAFFAIVYPVHLLTRGTRFEMPWLFAASYVFYGWWCPVYLLLILFSTAVDYFTVTRMAQSPRRRLWLALSIVSNLSVLAFFKYGMFFTENLNAVVAYLGIPYALPSPEGVLRHFIHLTGHLNHLLASAGIPLVLPAPTALLPVGISFFTFQSMSYTIDYYRGHIEREPSFIRYATYVSLFPQLVAGPIERSSNLLHQLRHQRSITREDIADGLSLFVVGFFKKVALSDFLALYVDKVYASPGQFRAPALLLATFAFGWRIYFDFAGYTDMARGLARLMGVRIMLNFNNPYLADSLGDFWSRWHISLSTWFRDYVYIPLGGNRRGQFHTYRNMFLTMVISGLWHGAAWTFLIWGALHALGRVCTRELERTAFYRQRIPRLAKQLAVFTFVTFTWIFFRAQSLGDAWLIVRRIFTSGWADPAFPLLALGMTLSLWLYQFLYESKARWLLEWAPLRVAIALFGVLYVATACAPSEKAFIYFQF